MRRTLRPASAPASSPRTPGVLPTTMLWTACRAAVGGEWSPSPDVPGPASFLSQERRHRGECPPGADDWRDDVSPPKRRMIPPAGTDAIRDADQGPHPPPRGGQVSPRSEASWPSLRPRGRDGERLRLIGDLASRSIADRKDESSWLTSRPSGSRSSSSRSGWSPGGGSGCRGTSTRPGRGSSPTPRRRRSWRPGVGLLAEYQERLAAQDTYGVVMVLQAMDAAGKDGTIRHVMSGVNPQGVQVSSFKVPSSEDLDHDYLWRYAKKLPERGNIGIFNRSYYEEVLVVRVHPRDPRRPEDAAVAPSAATSGSAASARSTTGSTTCPTRASGSPSCSSTSPRRSSAGGSWPGSTWPRRTGSSAPTTPRSGCSGTTTRRRSARC